MNLEALRIILTTRFQDGWKTGPAIYLPTEFENVEFTQPETGTWARFSIAGEDFGEASLGGQHERGALVIYAQIFAKPGAGSKPFAEAHDKFASIFNNWQYAAGGWDIEVRRAQLKTIGQNIDGKWFQKNISAAVRADFTE